MNLARLTPPTPPELLIVALAALLFPLNSAKLPGPLLLIVAEPAVVLWRKRTELLDPLFVTVAAPAVLLSIKNVPVRFPLLLIAALAAVELSWNRTKRDPGHDIHLLFHTTNVGRQLHGLGERTCRAHACQHAIAFRRVGGHFGKRGLCLDIFVLLEQGCGSLERSARSSGSLGDPIFVAAPRRNREDEQYSRGDQIAAVAVPQLFKLFAPDFLVHFVKNIGQDRSNPRLAHPRAELRRKLAMWRA